MAKLAKSAPITATDIRASNSAGQRLYGIVERMERLSEEKAALTEDMREVMDEAKATGFDPAVIRRVIQRRKLDVTALRELDEMVEVYETSVTNAELAVTKKSIVGGSDA
jgi:uncharacterized protein (UPF0335 family)